MTASPAIWKKMALEVAKERAASVGWFAEFAGQ
jgi:hypothetical protein